MITSYPIIPVEKLQEEYNHYFETRSYPEFTTEPHSVTIKNFNQTTYPWGIIKELNKAMDKYIKRKLY